MVGSQGEHFLSEGVSESRATPVPRPALHAAEAHSPSTLPSPRDAPCTAPLQQSGESPETSQVSLDPRGEQPVLAQATGPLVPARPVPPALSSVLTPQAPLPASPPRQRFPPLPGPLELRCVQCCRGRKQVQSVSECVSPRGTGHRHPAAVWRTPRKDETEPALQSALRRLTGESGRRSLDVA